MSDVEKSTQRHYSQPRLTESILAALNRMGKTPETLRPEDLAPVDAFHIRGHAATLELGRLVRVGPEHRVLDVGCGLGGSARYLARQFGCRVTGLDLTPEYLRTAADITGWLKMDGLVDFREGNALEMPFEDGAFDLVWSEHAQMNIPDKPGFYGEIHRVLKPGGRFAFHDILQGPGGEPHFPTPWARDDSHSGLIGSVDLRKLLQSLRFDVLYWEDKTAEGRDWFRERVTALKEKGPPPLGFHLLLGSVAMPSQENNLRNLEENRISLVQGMVQKVR
jgi:SAM-dependent methyltransferase